MLEGMEDNYDYETDLENRYVVELENNHHYIIIDIIEGYSFYCPCQEDANRLAGLLNQKDNLIRRLRQHKIRS